MDEIRPLADQPGDVERWEKILEMVDIGDMPPDEAPQPTEAHRAQLTTEIRKELKRLGRRPTGPDPALPEFANRIPHDELFSGKHKGPAWTPARVWRLNSHIYAQLLNDLELRDFIPPLNTLQDQAFDDYAVLYADEATIRTMMQNGRRVAETMIHGRLVKVRGAGERNPNNKSRRKTSRHRVLAEFADLPTHPSQAQMDEVVRYTFQ